MKINLIYILTQLVCQLTLAEEVSFSQLPIGNHSNMVWLNSIESIAGLGSQVICPEGPSSKSCGFCAKGVLEIKQDESSLCMKTLTAKTGFRLDSLCLSNSVTKERDTSITCREYFITNTVFSCSHHFVRDDKKVERTLKRFCSINKQGTCRGRSTTLQNQQVYWVLDSSGLYYMDELSIMNTQNASDILFYDCDGDCSLTKNGDSTFCANFHCSMLSTCYCSFKPDRLNLLVQTPNSKVNIYCYGLIKTTVQVDLSDQPITIGNNMYCANCIASCSDNLVNIKMYSSDYSHLRVCKSGICKFSDNIGSEVDIEMPYETFLTRTNVMIDIWSKHIKEHKTLIISCPVAEVCHVLKCTLCIPKLLNWHCFSSTDYLIWSIIAIVALIILVSLITLFKTVFTVISLLFWPILSLIKLLKWTMKLMTKSVGSEVERSRYHYKKLDDENFVPPGRDSKTKNPEFPEEERQISKHGYKVFPDRSRRPKTPKFGFTIMTILALIFFLVSLASSCSEFSYVSAKSRQCVKDNKSTRCRFKTVVDMDLSPVSQESCLGLTSNDGSSMGFLKIKTKSLDFVCDQSLLYYTFNPSASCQSIHSCWTSGFCYGVACESMSPRQKFNDILSPEQNLGESGCIRSCGGWTCGCFHFDEGCIFYRRDIKNDERRVVKVSRCNSWTLRTIIEVSIVSQNGSEQAAPERITLTSNNVVRFRDILIHIKSSSPPIVDTNWCLLTTEGLHSMSRCSSKDQFSHGIIGEVQCMSKFDAMYSKSSCKTDFNLIQTIQEEKSIRCRSSFANVDKILREYSLPIYENNYHFIMDGEDLILEEQSISRLVLQVSLDQLDVSSLSTLSKVYINSMHLSGCVNCITGAMLTVQARADEEGTLVHIDCNGFTTIVMIGSTDKIKEIIVKPTKFRYEYLCKITTTGESFNLTIKASLVNMMSSLTQDSIRVSNNVSYIPGEFMISEWISGLSLPGGSVIHLIYILVSYLLIITALIIMLLVVIKFFLKLLVRGLISLQAFKEH